MLVSRVHILLTLAVAIVGVSAQSFDECGDTCVNTTVAKGYCKALNDTSCVCTNKEFQTTLEACLTNCSTNDLTVAAQLQNATCSNVSTSTASSESSSATLLNPSSSLSRAPSSSATSATSSSGATPVEQLSFLSAIITIAGALMGGAFAL
ncbi:hypothetical protein BJV74DRAFT_189404 [Russula compacta]|nr:hypothetical protein BJV74DRAFT_189404 [Russula compacta]